jgi:hypothetical protein
VQQDAFFKGLHTLSRAWTLCKPHFYTLAKSAAFGLVPIYVLNQLLLYWSLGSLRFGRRGFFVDYGWTGMGIGTRLIASLLLTGIGLPLVVASITIFVAKLNAGRVPTLAEVWRTLAARAVPLAITGLIGGLAIALGLIMLFIPGVILFYLFCMSSIVTALENQGGPAALARSAWLTRRNWQETIVVWGVFACAQFVGSSFVDFLIRWVAHIMIVGPVLKGLLMALVLPIPTAALVLHYFDVRQEHEDADAIAATAAIAGAYAHARTDSARS